MLRVATYNVRSLRDDRAALVRMIKALRPDVLCLQEMPRLPGRRRAWRELAALTGMTIAAGCRAGGVAVFAGPGLRVVHGLGRPLRRFTGLERRAIALAVVERSGARYAACSFHLDLVGEARLRHAAEIVPAVEGAARAFGAHAVLAGDVNEEPDGPVWRYLAGRYTDCLAAAAGATGGTFPSPRPRARIDGIFADRGLRVVSCAVAAEPIHDVVRASDHRPVVAVLTPGAAPPVGRMPPAGRTIVP